MTVRGWKASFLILIALVGFESRATPRRVRVTGSTFDSAGTPLDGTFDFRLVAYSVASGGSALWTSSDSSFTATKGRFSLEVDATQGSPSLLSRIAALDTSDSLWFELRVDSQSGSDSVVTTPVSILPRFRARGGAFALSAVSTDSLRGFKISSTAPTNGQVLAWNGSSGAWEASTYAAGSVTSVSMTMPAILSVTGSPRTATGSLGLTWATQSANRFFSGPSSGVAAAPAFRALVAADLPTIGMGQGGTGANLTASNGKVVYSAGSTLGLTAVGTSGLPLASNGENAPAFAVAGIAGGGTGQTTRQAGLNALAADSQAAGDLMRFDGTDWVRLARGSSGQVLVATATDVAWQAEPSVELPSGVIVAWSGSVASVPPGWALCNGTSGTPDLRDRFVIAAGGSYAVAASGGSETHAHTASSTFTSGGALAHGHTASSTFTGTAAAHNHTTTMSFSSGSCSLQSSTVDYAKYSVVDGGMHLYSDGARPSNNHSCASVAGSVSSTINNGDYVPQGTVSTTINNSSALTPAGSVSSSVASSSHLPPFYALAFIMKL